MIALLLALSIAACAYKIVTALLFIRFAQETACVAKAPSYPSYSQVKPLQESNPQTLKAIDTFYRQDGVPAGGFYLCSACDGPSQWLQDHPEITWLRLEAEQNKNGKAATLAMGEPYWSGDIFVISDADMLAPANYLQAVLDLFSNPKVGVVTCVYRSTPVKLGAWGHLFESLCILDFSASVLVARQLEGMSFAMGSTMAIRRDTLSQIGGFQALTPYLADDFQLGNRAHQLGWEVHLAPCVLETSPAKGGLDSALSHQYRWLVTSRVSRPSGYFAFITTQGLLWTSLLTILKPSLGIPALALWCLIRILTGAKNHLSIGSSVKSLWQVLFLPWKDTLYLGLWLASLKGNTVLWGKRKLTIDSSGRIISPPTNSNP